MQLRAACGLRQEERGLKSAPNDPSQAGFLLGTWLADARALAVEAGHPEHADFLEWNARAQVTSWEPVLGEACGGGPGKLGGLYDYANKVRVCGCRIRRACL